MSIVRLTEVNKAFNDRSIIKDFTYEFEKGRIYAIIGASGAGKSTLLNMIGLMEYADSGSVELFDQKDLKLHSRKAMLLLRHKLAYLFQNFALIETMSVEQNLMIALEYSKSKRKKAEIDEALDKVGLKGFEKKKIHTLSGGEQQRVALARILLKPCELILADEPTGNLDEENKKEVFEILNQLKRQGKTIILVSHDTTIIEKCDEVIQLSKLSN